MNATAENIEYDEPEDTEVIESEPEDEQTSVEEAHMPEDPVEDDEDDEVEDEIVVSFGDEEPPKEETQRAPRWVRDLRKSHRELQRQNRELQAKLQSTQTEAKPVEVGQKPTLEQYDYDPDKYEQALMSWHERKRQADAEQQKAREAAEAQQQAWQEKLSGYAKAKAEMKVRDYDDAEATVSDALNVTQQGVILQGADNPALVIYALGKNPKKAEELSKISDPVKFAFAVAKLEKDMKVTNRKAPAPERAIRGNARSAGAVDSTLERLRAEAAKTGDYSKVTQYKRQKRASK